MTFMPTDLLHAHLPWSRRNEFLSLFGELGLGIEIGLTGPDLDQLHGSDIALPAEMRPPRQ